MAPHTLRFRLRPAPVAALLSGLLALAAAGPAPAATMTFGSPLSAPATLNTSIDLGYTGYGIPTILHEQAIVFHVYHDGADTALWNTSLGHGSAAAPASGQVLSVSLEGCAQPALEAPAPLTQIHFQDLVPSAGGGVQVNVTSGAFEIPVCGVGDAGRSTVTTYQPVNFCVNEGDYVDFNDEGGWNPADPLAYPSGVPYEVIGAGEGSSMNSFIAGNGTNNGATFSPEVKTDRNGFAANGGEELLLRAVLGTGPDATPLCPGGTKGEPPAGAAVRGSAGSGWHGHIPSATLPHQDDGMNRSGAVVVAVYCHLAVTCTGTVTLHVAGRGGHSLEAGKASFSVPSLHTGRAAVRLLPAARHFIRNAFGAISAQATLAFTSGLETTPFTEPFGLHGGRT
jgi:hypothetical protein